MNDINHGLEELPQLELLPETWARLCTQVHGGVIHRLRGASSPSVQRQRMCKPNVAYLYNGVLFSPKKEGNSGTCQKCGCTVRTLMLHEISQSQKDEY